MTATPLAGRKSNTIWPGGEGFGSLAKIGPAGYNYFGAGGSYNGNTLVLHTRAGSSILSPPTSRKNAPITLLHFVAWVGIIHIVKPP